MVFMARATHVLQCAEPYLALIFGECLEMGSVVRNFEIGVVWLLLVCVVRCWVKFCNECNFCF